MGDSVRWHQDVNFDLITISDPEAGGWKADADIDPDNRVQILSDLSLGVEGLPNSIFSGNPIELQIALNNAGEVVNEAAILGLTDVTLKVTAPDGRSGSKLLSDPESLPADGVFRETMSRLSQPGEYRFEITAVGRTFQRRQELTATLMEPLKVEVADDYGQQVTRIRVLPESDNMSSKNNSENQKKGQATRVRKSTKLPRENGGSEPVPTAKGNKARKKCEDG